MAGGEFPDGSASRSMWRYDPCFDTWQEMTSMNVPRSELGRHFALITGICSFKIVYVDIFVTHSQNCI